MSRREDGRLDDELRPVRITRGFTSHPAGSVLVEFGETRVMCTASVTEGVPRWRKGSGQGWLTAEYAMLPAATHERSDRESVKGRVGGRTQEISRLVGRSLRACIDLAALGENTIAIDCDVLQADGGTRTAAITGAYVALADAVTYLAAAGRLSDPRPLSCAIAAVSVGVVDGRIRVDLPYSEDSRAEVDMNVVATDTGTLVEIQGTGEGATFPRSTLDKMLDAAMGACEQIFRHPARGVGVAVSRRAARVGGPGEEGVRKLTDLSSGRFARPSRKLKTTPARRRQWTSSAPRWLRPIGRPLGLIFRSTVPASSPPPVESRTRVTRSHPWLRLRSCEGGRSESASRKPPTGSCTLPRLRDQQHMTDPHRRLRRRDVGTGAAAVPQVDQRLADALQFGLLPRIGR